MRHDALYLGDIVEAADEIASFVQGRTEDRFAADSIVRSAVLHKLTVVGEAAARVSRPLRERHPSIPWADIVAFRNIIVHAYFSLDWHTVWVAATRNAPLLRTQIAAVLAAESGGGEAPDEEPEAE